MTATEAIRLLRVSSRCHVVDLNAAKCAELADVFEEVNQKAATAALRVEMTTRAIQLALDTANATDVSISLVDDAFDSQVADAVSAEREACAQLVEEIGEEGPYPVYFRGAAGRIRERGTRHHGSNGAPNGK